MRWIPLFAIFVLAAFGFTIWFRNRAVYRYRRGILELMRDARPFDLDWRLDVYDSVSYDAMLYRFWKPLDSFYPDKSFLDLNDVRGFAPWEQPSGRT